MPMACRITPPLPEVSIPCRITRIFRSGASGTAPGGVEALLQVTELRRESLGGLRRVGLLAGEPRGPGRIQLGQVDGPGRQPQQLGHGRGGVRASHAVDCAATVCPTPGWRSVRRCRGAADLRSGWQRARVRSVTPSWSSSTGIRPRRRGPGCAPTSSAPWTGRSRAPTGAPAASTPSATSTSSPSIGRWPTPSWWPAEPPATRATGPSTWPRGSRPSGRPRAWLRCPPWWWSAGRPTSTRSSPPRPWVRAAR